MASQASQLLSTVTEKAKSMAGVENAKVASMAADTKDVHDKNHRITSDFGVKQSNTDSKSLCTHRI
jgi:catalase